jgi:hypothetical protein
MNESPGNSSTTDSDNSDHSLVWRAMSCYQVCSDIRTPNPRQQGMGMDITKIVQYLGTFWQAGLAQLARL